MRRFRPSFGEDLPARQELTTPQMLGLTGGSVVGAVLVAGLLILLTDYQNIFKKRDR
jgi:hypothetical protein